MKLVTFHHWIQSDKNDTTLQILEMPNVSMWLDVCCSEEEFLTNQHNLHKTLRVDFGGLSTGGNEGERNDWQGSNYGRLWASGWLSGPRVWTWILKPSGWFPWSGQEAVSGGTELCRGKPSSLMIPCECGGVTRSPCFCECRLNGLIENMPVGDVERGQAI